MAGWLAGRPAGKHCAGVIVEELHLIQKQEAERKSLDLVWAFETSKHMLSDTSFQATRPHLLILLNSPPTGNQTLKDVTLWIPHSHLNHNINWDGKSHPGCGWYCLMHWAPICVSRRSLLSKQAGSLGAFFCSVLDCRYSVTSLNFYLD